MYMTPGAYSLRLIICLALCFIFSPMQGQIVNPGFENWDSLYKSPYQYELDTVYHVPGASCGRISKWKTVSTVGVVRTTDSYQGKYAIVLHNWYFYAQETLYLYDNIDFKPENLSGYYKYHTGGSEGLARGSLIVALLKSNGQVFDTIAKGIQYFDSTETYKSFVTPLQYFSQTMPDSISITVVNSDRNCKTQGICHLLYLDGLSLSDPAASVSSNIKYAELSVFPNPTNDKIIFKNNSRGFELIMYNVDGEMILNEKTDVDQNEITLSSLKNGFYFYRISLSTGESYSGKVIKE
jgi:hypothetical protein